LLRLSYDLKRPYIRRMEAVCREVGLPFYVSDSHHKEASCGGNCCGMPETGPLGQWQRGQFTQAVQLAKRNGQVTWAEVEALAGDLATVPYYRATCFNAGSTENRAKRRYQTMLDFMHETWNDVHGALSPARYFGGSLVAGGPDSRGDVVYFYNRPWVEDGRRIELGSDLRAEGA
jgi:hypothetical protein